MIIWLKIILGIIFIIIPGFSIRDNYDKRPILTALALIFGLAWLVYSINPLMIDNNEIQSLKYQVKSLTTQSEKEEALFQQEMEQRDFASKYLYTDYKNSPNKDQLMRDALDKRINFLKSSIESIKRSTDSYEPNFSFRPTMQKIITYEAKKELEMLNDFLKKELSTKASMKNNGKPNVN